MTNSTDYDRDLFFERVAKSMHRANMDWDALSSKFCEQGYTITTANLRTYILQRNLSLRVLLFLSKALGVSMDYLIGNEQNMSVELNDGFDYEFGSQRYNQYSGDFLVYFFPTRTNEAEELIVAHLHIDSLKNYMATLEIPVSGASPKKYTGRLLLSQKTDTAFLNMMCCNGEVVQFIFNDPNTFQNKIRFCVAGLISVSSGDSKRMPTLSRAIITEEKLSNDGVLFAKANLRLNSKYIGIEKEKLLFVLESFFVSEGIGDAENIKMRLAAAFKLRECLFIEEKYFLNTFKKENGLSEIQVERLIADLRNASLSNINSKIPRSIDSRLYLLLKNEDSLTD